MNYSVKNVKDILAGCITELSMNAQLFLKNPAKDFSRNRKLSFVQMLESILCMGGGSLSNELLDFFHCSPNLPSKSAFGQQREKILPEAFENLFHLFSNAVDSNSTYKGFRLLAVDGSDIKIATNPNDAASFFPGANEQAPYNLLHLNATYDLISHTYSDAIIQRAREANEHEAFVRMVGRYSYPCPAIFIADRGFESYNNMAHIQEKGCYFLIRIKDISSKGIAGGLDLPQKAEFDLPIHLFLTRRQTKEIKELCKDKNACKFIPSNSQFDFLPPRSDWFAPLEFYELFFRVVRFKITDDTFEVVVTNLDADSFPPDELKKLYAMRWGIETSFRDLKYTVGLLHFHAKKVEYIFQEIFAKLTMYNFTELITSLVIVQQKDKKYCYKANFSAAVHICRSYILKNISPPNVEALISMHITPIRPNRKWPRKMTSKAVVSFMYRIA